MTAIGYVRQLMIYCARCFVIMKMGTVIIQLLYFIKILIYYYFVELKNISKLCTHLLIKEKKQAG